VGNAHPTLHDSTFLVRYSIFSSGRQERAGPLTLYALHIDQVIGRAEISHEFGIDPTIIHKD
jgi:hypothetical protein